MKTLAFALALVVTIVGSIPAQAQSQFGQQGPKLVGTGASGNAAQGFSVSLSGDGNTAIVGACRLWEEASSGLRFRRRLDFHPFGRRVEPARRETRRRRPYPAEFPARIGSSVSLSGDGNTAVVGGPADNNFAGAAWVFTRSSGVWSQLGAKLVGAGAIGPYPAEQGLSVSLSGDANTVIMGGPADNNFAGAAWCTLYRRSLGRLDIATVTARVSRQWPGNLAA